MNVQEHRSPRRARRHTATGANGAVVDARQDADVADHQIKVALAAYFIAEKRGFEPGHELEDWLAAEAEIAKVEPLPALTSIQSSPSGSAS